MSLSSIKSTNPNRLFYFDILRAAACLCVVMIHVSAQYVLKEVGSLEFWIGNLFDSMSRAGVPLFVMISGALMLDEDYTFTKEKWFRHIIKMFLFFVFWSIVYSLVYQICIPFIKDEEINVFSIVRSLLKGHYHLWFVPMIIGLYLMVPLLRLWIKRQNKQYVEYFLILSFIFSFLIPQSIDLLVCINSKFKFLYEVIENLHIKYTSGFTSYFILGWYLHNYELTHKKLLYSLGFAGVCISFLGTYGVFAYAHSSELIFYSNFSVNVLLHSIAIFVFAKSTYGNVQYSSTFLHMATSLIIRNSLGVYAVHAIVLTVVSPLLSQIHVLIAVPSIFVVCTIISLIISLVINKIPFFRKFV